MPIDLAARIAEKLPELQRQAESRMRSAIRFTRPGEGEPVWNPETEQYEAPRETVYEGKCRVKWANPASQDADAGEAAWAADRTPTVHLPVNAPGSADVGDGHVGIITAVAPNSGCVVGMKFTAISGHYGDDLTARRIPCQVVSRDA